MADSKEKGREARQEHAIGHWSNFIKVLLKKNDLIMESFGLILGGGETVIAWMSVGSQVHRDRG